MGRRPLLEHVRAALHRARHPRAGAYAPPPSLDNVAERTGPELRAAVVLAAADALLDTESGGWSDGGTTTVSRTSLERLRASVDAAR